MSSYAQARVLGGEELMVHCQLFEPEQSNRLGTFHILFPLEGGIIGSKDLLQYLFIEHNSNCQVLVWSP